MPPEDDPTETPEFDTSNALQAATDKPRANLIADIVGHPEDAPSIDELDYMNPSLEEDAIRRCCNALVEVGILEELVIESGERTKGYPYKFYTLSEQARDLFDRTDLFPKRPWKRQYKRVTKTPEIRELQQIPRPI
jgi:hypothetical protein